VNTVNVSGRTVEVTHADRVVFPESGTTKGEVVEYYHRIAERMLPYVEGRPLVLRRFPGGLAEGGFFQKEAPEHYPGWIRRTTVDKVGGGSTTYVVADDAATVVYLANQGTIELHTLLAPADRPGAPNELVLDLDPSTDDLDPVVAGARTIRELLDDLGVVGFVSSTGSRGVHVHVDLAGPTTFDEARDLSRRLAEAVVDRDRSTFTVAHSKADRGDRLFVDALRNAYGQHAVAPFSLRARDDAPVSVPLTWDEATASDLDPRGVTIANVFRRLGAQRQDPWAARGRHRYRLDALGGRLDRLSDASSR
jgi:bifunctional non-homologous end joining protein LigD